MSKHWKIWLLLFPIIGTCAMAQGPGSQAGFFQAWWTGVPWTPNLTPGLAMWLDSSDRTTLWADTNATVVATNNGIVRLWSDKSGNNKNAIGDQGSDTYPTRDQLGIRFDGTNDTMNLSDATFIPLNNVFFAVVYEPLNAEVGINKFSFAANSIAGNSKRLYQIYNLSTHQSIVGDTATTITTNYVSGTHQHLTVANGTNHFYYFNGKLAGSLSQASTNKPDRARIGSFITTLGDQPLSPYSQMLAKEYIIYTNQLSAANRQKLEGYLAHKWGLTAELPANHPYKNTYPRAN